MKKIVIVSVIAIFVLVLSFFSYPIIKEKLERRKLESNVMLVSNYLKKNEGNYEEIKTKLEESNSILEKDINNYLTIVLEKYNNLEVLINNSIHKTCLISKECLSKELEEEKAKYLLQKEDLSNINIDDYVSDLNEEELKVFHELIAKEIDLKINLDNLDKEINEIDSLLKIKAYLEKNKSNIDMSDNIFIFKKRKVYDEYQELLISLGKDDLTNYELVKDTVAPKINASDITITKGTKININDKIKCVDDVDDNVTCNITGNYDVNKVGTYNIKITSADKENNASNKTIKLIVKEKVVNKKPYYIEVIRNQNIVIVYGLDSNNEYTKIVKVFVCSVGLNNKTPTGTFKTSDKSSWGWLVGNVYGQYYTRITGSILFHSVPYFKKSKNQLEWEEYNKLGTAASKGCVRMTVRDVKWIYDNCPSGTTVKIYDGNIPNGVSKPTAIKISSDSPNKGWDPTDPDKNNPWKK